MKMIYAKASTERRPAFRQQTVILEGNGRRVVRKLSAHPAAQAHIRSYAENARLLREQVREGAAIRIAPCDMSGDSAVEFPFYADPSLASRLASLSPADYLPEVRRWEQALTEAFGVMDFECTEGFSSLFGTVCGLSGQRALRLTNLDMNFDNIFLTEENEYTLLDYEWVFPFPIPLAFVLFRALVSDVAFAGFREDAQAEILEGLGITPEMKDTFWQMEYAFQRYVACDEEKLDYYIDPAHTLRASVFLDEIPSLRNQLAVYKEAYDRQQKTISDLHSQVVRLSDFRSMIHRTLWFRLFYRGKDKE